MKLVLVLFTLLLGSFSLSSHADGFFVGAEASPYVAWKDCYFYALCTKDASTDGNSKGGGVRIGYWLSPAGNSRDGVEIVYDKFSSVSGSEEWFPNGCSVFCNPPSAIANWKNDGELIYVDWFGYMLNRNRSWVNGLLAKAGIFASSVKTEGDYGQGGGTYERKVSGVGVVFGMGYLIPLSEHISARAALDMFFNVKVADPLSTADTLSDTLLNLSLGLDYYF